MKFVIAAGSILIVGFVALMLGLVVVSVAHAAEPPLAAKKYQRHLIAAARSQFGLNAPVALMASQVHQESAWDENARSSVGATGLAQFMAATAKWIVQAYPELGLPEPANPVWALRALAIYDRFLFERSNYMADECETFALVLAKYNGGERHAEREIELCAGDLSCTPWRWFGNAEKFNDGRTLDNWKQNRAYPRAIIARQPMYATWGRSVTCSVS